MRIFNPNDIVELTGSGSLIACKDTLCLSNPMNPTLCILGGCNGAGKTTFARELLPQLGLMRPPGARVSEPAALR